MIEIPRSAEYSAAGSVPRLSRIAVMWEPKNAGSEQVWKECQLAARELGLQLRSAQVSRADDFEGAKPADLPVEQPARFELFINGKTARTLGLAIPQELLISANRIFE